MEKPLYVLLAVAGKNTKLEETLESLSRCYKPPNYVATVVVENGIKYDAEEIVNRFTENLQARYLYHSKGNKSNALNVGMENISEEDALLFLTDDDVKFDTEILLHYQRVASSISGSAYFGGKMLAHYEQVPPNWLLPILPTSSANWPPVHYAVEKQHRFLGMNWGAYLRDLRQVGGFDIRFGPGTVPRRVGQEHNMQDRLFAAGVKAVFIPEATVWHYIPKEKSDLKFALSRNQQFGIRKGIMMKSERKALPLILSKAFVYFFKPILMIVLAIFTLSRKRLVRARADVHIGIGMLQGYFLRHNV